MLVLLQAYAYSVPHAFGLAWQALNDVGKIKKKQQLLINRGGGGVGLFVVQLAKGYDCQVTGVDTSEKHALMTSMGYDHVIDYKTTNFTKENNTYNLILDCKTSQSAFAYKRVLKPKGRYITIGGRLIQLFSVLLWGKLISKFSEKKYQLVGLAQNKDLDYYLELYTHGKIKLRLMVLTISRKSHDYCSILVMESTTVKL